MAPVTSIRNLGPAMAEQFARAGVLDAETLRRLGADEAYIRLLLSGHRAHFMAFTALVLGLQDRGFRELPSGEKAALRARFDTVKTRADKEKRHARPDAAFDALMNEIGVRPAQPTSSRPEKK